MSQHNKTTKPLTLALGATFIATMAASNFASAATQGSNPFAMSDVHSSYTQLAEKAKDGKCGEGKCGADKLKAQKQTKEGKCGGDKAKAKMDPKPKEGKCGGAK